MKNVPLVVVLAAGLTGCATWETSNAASVDTPIEAIAPQNVKLTSANFDASAYQKVQDLKVSVNKTTAFHPEPSPELVEQELREEAAKIGATKVFNVTISGVKITPFSWGSRQGTGIAAKPKS